MNSYALITGRIWLTAVIAALMLGVTSGASAVAQEVCTRSERSLPGETLQDFAERLLGDRERWPQIFYINDDGRLPADVTQVMQRTDLAIPCDARERLERPPGEGEIKFLTGGDYSPFTDRDWFREGLITEIVRESMENTPEKPVTFSITWNDKWSEHLKPLLYNLDYDMGFPWLKPPECPQDRTIERCRFRFSISLFEMRIVLYVRADSDFTFPDDASIHGLTICRPSGYFTHDLDREGRRWLSSGLIDFRSPETIDECFDALADGSVDAVTINEFTGKRKVFERDEIGKVRELSRPVSIEGLHVLVPEGHYRGTAILQRFNNGVRTLRQRDRYNHIVANHLRRFYDTVNWPSQ